jgi:hypothetical protein
MDAIAMIPGGSQQGMAMEALYGCHGRFFASCGIAANRRVAQSAVSGAAPWDVETDSIRRFFSSPRLIFVLHEENSANATDVIHLSVMHLSFEIDYSSYLNVTPSRSHLTTSAK